MAYITMGMSRMSDEQGAILNAEEIVEEIRYGSIVIEPFNEAQLNPNSYNLTLGNDFYQVTWHDGVPTFTRYFYEDGYEVPIPIGGTLLGMTKEVAGAFHTFVPELRARSSVGRLGIAVCKDAGFGDVGYVNKWTTQLTGFVTAPDINDPAYWPRLKVGETFAQILFFRSKFSLNARYNGQYRSMKFPEAMIPAKYR